MLGHVHVRCDNTTYPARQVRAVAKQAVGSQLWEVVQDTKRAGTWNQRSGECLSAMLALRVGANHTACASFNLFEFANTASGGTMECITFPVQ